MKLLFQAFALSIAALTSLPYASSAAATDRVELSIRDQSDEAPSHAKRHYSHIRAYRNWPEYQAPVACLSVRFPRSPLCATIPAPLSPYGLTAPWLSFWSARY
jgi:hypothetical protein